jgi:hypothetical protein
MTTGEALRGTTAADRLALIAITTRILRREWTSPGITMFGLVRSGEGTAAAAAGTIAIMRMTGAFTGTGGVNLVLSVLRIRIRRIHIFWASRIRNRRINMFLGLPDPDPLVRDMDLDPSISKQK